MEPVVWQTEIREVVDSLRAVAMDKQLALELAMPETELVSSMDRRLLRQVLMNIVVNAIKYTARGCVTVRLAVQGSAMGSDLLVSVEDTGVGISEVDMARLFQPFARVGDHPEKPEGTGLGLHLSQRFMELVGGRIEVTSRPGVGSRFTLVFPDLGGADGRARAGD